jgi:glutaredoxin
LPPLSLRDKIALMRDVVVYSRPGCHLCDVVKETLRSLENLGTFQWREVNIDEDPELRQLYWDQIPVVFVDGRKSFKYHMKQSDFLRRLQG